MSKQEPENIRMGAPYDNPAFESFCREHGIWGTAQAALCAVFWQKADAALAESIGAGGVSALIPGAPEIMAERERCAVLVEGLTLRKRLLFSGMNGTALEPCSLAAAIRQSGE